MLRPYQQESVKAIHKEWDDGRKNVLLVLPTGTGKTVCFSQVIKDQICDGSRALIILLQTQTKRWEEKKKKKAWHYEIFLLLDSSTTTAQMKKIGIVHGKPYVYIPENVKKSKDEIIKHLRPFKPDVPLAGPF